MKVLYFGSACDREWFNKILIRKNMPFRVAQYMFEMALIKGFADIGNIDMKIYYIYQEDYYPKGEYLLFKSRRRKLNSKFLVTYLPYINLPILRELSYFIVGAVLTLIWIFKNRKESRKVILTPFNYTPLSLGIFIIAKFFRVKRVNIFTDLSNHILTKERQKNMIWVKRLILPYYIKLVNLLERYYDGYVLFTEPMNNKVNPYKKPFIVIEGIFNNNLNLSEVPKSKAIMYAGTLSYEYGVKHILEIFEQIKDEELQLWLFGDGDMKNDIKEFCSKDKRVKYFGFKPREEVFEYEKKAKLLINIRNPKDEYTMYSFPSKTFEYMVSGTPVLTTKLKGIPEEYYDYLYTVNEYKLDTIKKKIEEILSKPQSELDSMGKKARQFILENKDSITQARKILDMINDQILE